MTPTYGTNPLREGFNVDVSGEIAAAARNNMPKTKTYRTWFAGIVLAGVLLLLQTPLIASSGARPDQNRQRSGSPSVVARMNYTQGSVSFSPAVKATG